jgi:hypothetical protein
MKRSFFVRIKSFSIFITALMAVSIAACGENLESGNGCPLLCPPESAPLKDTIVDAVVLDTSLVGFPALGFETSLFLARLGDTLDTRVIARYDSLPQTYRFQNVDSAIVRIDSAFITFFRPVADSAIGFAGDGSIEVYDVTDATNDTSAASLAAVMTAGNLIGQTSFAVGESPDSIKILVDTARVRSRLLNGRNLRVGLRMVSPGSELVRVVSLNGGSGVLLTVIPNRAEGAQSFTFPPRSYTPADVRFLQAALADFAITVVGTTPPAGVLRVGGAPAHRVLLKFNIPSRIVDSSVVVRATLMLTQRSSTGPNAGAAVGVQIVPIVASSEITDLRTQLEFAGSSQLFRVDSVLTIPKDAGVVSLEMVRLVRAWRLQDTIRTPRLAALFLSSEATRPSAFEFYSSEAAAALRPRLRITYVSRVGSGQP